MFGQTGPISGNLGHGYQAAHRHPWLVNGDPIERGVVAGCLERYEPAVAVAYKESCTSLGLKRFDIFSFSIHAVVVALRSAHPSTAPLDGVHREAISQGIGEVDVVVGRRQHSWYQDQGRAVADCSHLDLRSVR